MKQSISERRVAALNRLQMTAFENSRAKRTGSLTNEEWQDRKDADIDHLEDLIHGRKTN